MSIGSAGPKPGRSIRDHLEPQTALARERHEVTKAIQEHEHPTVISQSAASGVDQSIDDFDPQSLIRYNIFVDGELASVIVGGGRTVVSGQPGANTVTIVAVDTAGNESAPLSIRVEI